jgi:hypothetical protein
VSEFTDLHVPDGFQGLLEISSEARIFAVGRRGHYNERGEYLTSSVPAIESTSGATGVEKILPHLVDGGGYSTKIVIFSGTPGQTGGGTLRLFNTSGTPAVQFPLVQ